MRITNKRWLLLGWLIPLSAAGHDYPTVDRVEYVLECMQNHSAKHEYLYKCSCVIDTIAQTVTYDNYVSMLTVSRYRALGGERGAEFRDTQQAKEDLKRFDEITAAADRRCEVR